MEGGGGITGGEGAYRCLGLRVGQQGSQVFHFLARLFVALVYLCQCFGLTVLCLTGCFQLDSLWWRVVGEVGRNMLF